MPYAKEGAKVVIGDIEHMRAEVEETLAQVKAAGSEGIFAPTDVSQADQARNLVGTFEATYGRLDIAFNNAGVLATGFSADVQEADFDRIMAVDVKPVWLSRQAKQAWTPQKSSPISRCGRRSFTSCTGLQPRSR